MAPRTPTACSAGSWPATSRPTSSRRPTTAVAFRDVNPQAPTHALVVPRSHYADAASPGRRRARDRGRRWSGWPATWPGADGLDEYRLVFNTGAAAGQTVFHTHLHVLGGRAMTWPPG